MVNPNQKYVQFLPEKGRIPCTKNDQQIARLEPREPPTIQVLGTTELLEIILMYLPMKDLLLSQRVCRSWHALINTSIRLRRALFLEPVPCGDISYIDWRLDDKGFYDDVHARLSLGDHLRGPNRDQIPRRYPSHWGKTRNDQGRYRIFVNPLLEQLFPVLTADGLYWHGKTDDLPKPVLYEHASWRFMFFTQPPVNCMAVEWDSANNEDEDGGGNADWTITAVRKLRETKGLTMVELYAQLVGIGRLAWIEGRGDWEEYRGAADLEKIVVD